MCECPSSNEPRMVHLLLKRLLFTSGREIMLTRYRCIKKRNKKSICIKNLQMPNQKQIFFEKAQGKVQRYFINQAQVLTLQLDEAENRNF